jgi:hypothetical protein
MGVVTRPWLRRKPWDTGTARLVRTLKKAPPPLFRGDVRAPRAVSRMVSGQRTLLGNLAGSHCILGIGERSARASLQQSRRRDSGPNALRFRLRQTPCLGGYLLDQLIRVRCM